MGNFQKRHVGKVGLCILRICELLRKERHESTPWLLALRLGMKL